MSDEIPTEEWLRLQAELRESVARTLEGTPWAPPDGSVLTECVVVMGWNSLDGTYGSSHLRCGSPWGTHGLVVQALARIEEHEYQEDDDL